MKPFDGAPATLGSVAAARTRAIVSCKDCHYQLEPEMSAHVRRYGAKVPIRDWVARLVCSQCGSGNIDFVLTGARK